MQRFQKVVLNTKAMPVQSATITVRAQATPAGSGAISTIFSDNGVTSLANPFTGDSIGNFFFYAADGRYDIVISGGTPIITTPFTIADIELSDVTSGVITDTVWQVDTATIGVLNDIRMVDGSKFATIQAAITDAGSTGSLLIPSSYTGVDTYTNPNNIPVIDLRDGNKSYRGFISVRDFGAKGDGITDDTSAIQAAIDAEKGIVGLWYTGINDTPLVFFPEGIYIISSPLRISSGIYLRGAGQGSKIKASGGFVGNRLIDIIFIDNFYTGRVTDMEFVSSAGSGIAAIADDGLNTTFVIDSVFQNLWLNSAQGLLFTGYAQANLIDNIKSWGPIDKILHLKGNFNEIKRIDKDGGTGSSTDPYILVEAHNLGSNIESKGNSFEAILIEGITSVNKSGIKFDGTVQTHLNGYWFEPTASDGYALRIVNSLDGIRISGIFRAATDSLTKIQVNNTRSVYFEHLDVEGTDQDVSAVLEIDSTSHVAIGDLQSRRGNSQYRIDRLDRNLWISRHLNRQIFTDASVGRSHISLVRYLTAENLLTNSSFEAGNTGWSFDAAPTGTEEYVTSEVSSGNMGHFIWTGGAVTRTIFQGITVPIEWVGRALTFTALAKMTGAAGAFNVPYINGAGITPSSNYNRASTDTGWHIIQQTFIVQSAGSVDVGVRFVNVQTGVDIYIDDFSLSFGSEGIIQPGIKTLDVQTNVNPDGNGMKHSRITTGSIASLGSAAVTLTWTTPFADANYSVQCAVVEADTDVLTLHVDHIESISASQVVVRVENRDAGAAKTGTLHLIAVHD